MVTAPSENSKQSADLLVLDADLVTMDGNRRVIRNGALATHGGRITWMGAATQARKIFESTRTINANGRIVLPGLVDTHFHTGQQLLRGKLTELARRRRLKLPIWRNYLIPFESVLTEEDMYLSSQIAYANLLRGGHNVFHRRRRAAPT